MTEIIEKSNLTYLESVARSQLLNIGGGIFTHQGFCVYEVLAHRDGQSILLSLIVNNGPCYYYND